MADVSISDLSRALSTNTGAIIPITIAGVTYGIPVSAIITASGDMGSGFFQLPTGTSVNRPNNPQTGSIRWNTTLSAIETFNGVNWSGDKLNIDVLVVGGGGGGGVNCGAGGGGGAVIVASTTLDVNVSYNVFVGAGGTGVSDNSAYSANVRGNPGSSSLFNNVIATGGGGGGSYNGTSGGPGANGGGGGNVSGLGGIGTAPSLPAGVTGNVYAGFKGAQAQAPQHLGGGGGGAGGNATDLSGNGAPGVQINFEGVPYYYGGGGGAGGWIYVGGNGGLGGGGGGGGGYSGGAGNGGTGGRNNGSNGVFAQNSVNTGNGGANTGGGGGGATFYGYNGARGANGGSGIVQVRYLGAQRATGGDRIFQATINQALYTIHEFTTIGPATFRVSSV